MNIIKWLFEGDESDKRCFDNVHKEFFSSPLRVVYFIFLISLSIAVIEIIEVKYIPMLQDYMNEQKAN